jgi:hypothetical protein
MTTRKRVSTPKPVKSAFKVVAEGTINGYPEREVEINKILRRSEASSSAYTLEQFEAEIQRILPQTTSTRKSSRGDKRSTGKVPGRASKRVSRAQDGTKGTAKKRKKATSRKRITAKR